AIVPSGGRECRSCFRQRNRRRCAPVAKDRLVLARFAVKPAVRQRPRRDAEIVGGGDLWGCSTQQANRAEKLQIRGSNGNARPWHPGLPLQWLGYGTA